MQNLLTWFLSNISCQPDFYNFIYWPMYTLLLIRRAESSEMADTFERSNKLSDIVIYSKQSINRRSCHRSGGDLILQMEIMNLEGDPSLLSWKPRHIMPGSYPDCRWPYDGIPVYLANKPEKDERESPCTFEHVLVSGLTRRTNVHT